MRPACRQTHPDDDGVRSPSENGIYCLRLPREPKQIATLAQKGCDFAIYNWLADKMNDAWRPEPGTPLWKFYFRVDLASTSQLMASGAVSNA